MRIEALAHVLFDPECLPARDDPAAVHEGCLRDAQDRNRDDCPEEVVGATLLLDPGDRLADDEDDRNRGRLGEDREDGRDEQRPAVRPQEAEQADERSAVGDVAHASECIRASSRRTWTSALPSRARFVGSLSQPLAPEGWGSGTTIASPRVKL